MSSDCAVRSSAIRFIPRSCSPKLEWATGSPCQAMSRRTVRAIPCRRTKNEANFYDPPPYFCNFSHARIDRRRRLSHRRLADVFDNRRTFLTRICGPIERALYRLAGVEPDIEQKWREYAIAMVLFGGVCMFGLYALLRLQGWLPLNPQAVPGVPPDL